LNRGAEIDAKTNKGFTPLHIASQNGNLECVKELLTQGAEIDAKSNFL